MTPSVGRIVHYILKDGPSAGHHRPAIIVKVLGKNNENSAVNLQVFTDGHGDLKENVTRVIGVVQGMDYGTFHEPEKVT